MTNRRQFLFLAGSGGAARGCSAAAARPPRGREFRGDDDRRRVAQKLGPAAYEVLRHEDTERPFTSPLNDEHRAGIFPCKGCALPLYSSKTKFESGTGWPSFWAPLPNAVADADRRDRWGWRGPRSIAAAAAGISAMSSTTARSRPASAIA